MAKSEQEKLADKLKSERDKLVQKYAPISYEKYKTFQKNLPVLSFGVFDLDCASGAVDPTLGNGGLRARDTALVIGRNGSAKTAVANAMIRETQRRFPDKDIVCIFTEAQAMERLAKEGVDASKLIILYQFHPELPPNLATAEAALDGMLEFCKLESTILCVIDSVAMLEPSGEQDKEMGESSQVAGLAKHYNRFVTRFVNYTHTAPLLQINHWSPQVDTKPKFGGKKSTENILSTHTVGGYKKDFLAKLGIILEQSLDYDPKATAQASTGKKAPRGIKSNGKFYRNKYAPPMRQVEICFDTDNLRFNNAEQTIDKAVYFAYVEGKDKTGKAIRGTVLNPGIIQAGAYYHIDGVKLNSKAEAIAYLDEHPDLMRAIQNQIVPRAKEFFLDQKPKGGEQDEDSMDK